MPERMHVVPLGDLILHDMSSDCVCGPLLSVEEEPSGQCAWVYVHASLDGREQQETTELDG